MKRSRRRLLATSGIVALGLPVAGLWAGCSDQDCVRGLYTIRETRETPAGTLCGAAQPQPAPELPRTCDSWACGSVCPRLRLTDGTPIVASRCTQLPVAATAASSSAGSGTSGAGAGGTSSAGGAGGVGGVGGLGGMSAGGAGGAGGAGVGGAAVGGAGVGGVGGASGGVPSGQISCEYDLDVDYCTTRQQARGGR